MGFLEYVDSVKGGKLFPLLEPDRYGCRTAAYSKRFGRWLNRLGITSGLKVFHSFRHLFKDACRIVEIPRHTEDRLTGHAKPTVGDRYGLGVPLAQAAGYVGRITYQTFVLPPKRKYVDVATAQHTTPAKAEARRIPRGVKRMPRRAKQQAGVGGGATIGGDAATG